MIDINLKNLPKYYEIQIHRENFNFTFEILEIIELNKNLKISEQFTEEHNPHYFTYPSVIKCLEVADRIIKRISQDKEFNMAAIDLINCLTRYEIHIKKQWYNYYFAVVKVTQLNNNITIAEHLEIKSPPDEGVYPSFEDAINAALIVIKRIAPNANVEINIKPLPEEKNKNKPSE